MLELLPDSIRVCILAFSAAIAVFDLLRSDVVAADMLPAEGLLAEGVIDSIEDTLTARVVPLGRCRSAAVAAIRSLR